MSVLVKSLPSYDPKLFHVYVKGAPEKIRKLCRPETGVSLSASLISASLCGWVWSYICTVPEDFFDVLSLFTQKGMRVLHRTVISHDIRKIERSVCGRYGVCV